MSQKVLLNKREPLKQFDQENGRWPREERYNKFTNKKKSDRRFFLKQRNQVSRQRINNY